MPPNEVMATSLEIQMGRTATPCQETVTSGEGVLPGAILPTADADADAAGLAVPPVSPSPRVPLGAPTPQTTRE